jgi:putative aldouronate transport system substrate-binding protein
MNRISKVACMTVAVVLSISTLLTGCGSNSSETNATTAVATSQASQDSQASTVAETPAGPDISKHAKLTWVMLGDPAKDFDTVAAELNKKVNTDLNAEVAFSWIGWGDLSAKYPLMLMSGQNVDAIYSCSWMDFVGNARKGAFTELTQDMLTKYAPNALKKLPEQAWKDASVDGKVIAIPRNFLEYQDAGVAVRGDIMKKAGLTKIASLDDVATYFAAVKSVDSALIPYNASGNSGDWPLTYFSTPDLFSVNGTNNLFTYNPLEPKPVIKCAFEDENLKAAYLKVRDLYVKGYISKSVLNNKSQSKETFESGQSAMGQYADNQFRDSYNKINTAHPEWDVQFFSFKPNGPFLKLQYNAGMVSIPASSQNKERTLMLLDKFYESSDYYMLLIYGIEGKHWQYNADKSMIQVPTGTDKDLYPKWQHPWGFGDWAAFNKPSDTDYPGYAEHINFMIGAAKVNPYGNFEPVTDSIKNELAAMTAVNTKYGSALAYGVTDIAETLKKANAEFKTAGVEKVRAELQKQLDAYTPQN